MTWDKYGLCECGYFARTSFGNPWFWPEVCPGCGEWPGDSYGGKGKWRLVVGRPRGFFQSRLEVKGETDG